MNASAVLSRLKRIENNFNESRPKVIEVIPLDHGDDEDAALAAHCKEKAIAEDSIDTVIFLYRFATGWEAPPESPIDRQVERPCFECNQDAFDL